VIVIAWIERSGGTVSEPCKSSGASRQSPRYSPSFSLPRGDPVKNRMVLGAVACCIPLMTSLSVASATEHRSREVVSEFQREHPCPSTGKATGACPGYRKDHIVPLACGGPDAVFNLQWQTIGDARAKDKWERRTCGR